MTNLRKVPGLSDEFIARLGVKVPPRATARTVSYSRAENQRILNAARRTVRAAAWRIRGNLTLAERWQAGELACAPAQDRQRAELIAYARQHADIPRHPGGQPHDWVIRSGTAKRHVRSVHLSSAEAAAFTVLLVGLTGQNRGTIVAAPAAHHRPDGYAAGIASAIIRLDKPRRGSRRHMDVALTDVPAWIPVPRERRTAATPRRGRTTICTRRSASTCCFMSWPRGQADRQAATG